MIVFGMKMYGKVDQVPGLFHLATEFFHIQFAPLSPTRSFIVLDGAGNRGIRIGLSGKSIIFAYLRASLVITWIVALYWAYEFRDELVPALIVAAACVPLFFLTYVLSRPSPIRAYRLAMKAGLPMGKLAEYYARTLTPEQLDDLARRVSDSEQAAPPDNTSL